MGVQQLDDEMIKLSGRKQKAKHVFQTLEWCQELGLRSSVDLIFGWPRETADLMLRDLDAVVRAGASHITQHELNVAGRTDFARNRRDELPSTEDNLRLYSISREFLESHGQVLRGLRQGPGLRRRLRPRADHREPPGAVRDLAPDSPLAPRSRLRGDVIGGAGIGGARTRAPRSS